MRHKRLVLEIMVVLACAALIAAVVVSNQGCAEFTARDASTTLMQAYLQQDADYRLDIQLPSLTNAEREVLRERRKLLIEAKPLIEMYDSGAAIVTMPDGGKIGRAELYSRITTVLDRLQKLAVRGM